MYLATAAPLAFAWFTNILDLTCNQLLDWATKFDTGAVSYYGGQMYHMAKPMLEVNAEFFKATCRGSAAEVCRKDGKSLQFSPLILDPESDLAESRSPWPRLNALGANSDDLCKRQ
ncbi:hypothetical protein RSOLAG1IB_08935 [Rhizoctonia solani AG-1 IB]|uniref:Uncharacterized protein n=1 Tax=Thanatephorus cucumeris (strain AG1-IB / isolate 7/3/14) TaxID=1108050 RepID=A0A0B7FPQ8_THACB|nr:hypothetical protein RSOLAG1IB_08935 [Rhizoctonia solani AG-1 IB]